MKKKELNKKFLKALSGDYIEVKRKIQKGWDEYERAIKTRKIIGTRDLFHKFIGKYRYEYSSPKGKISLIKIPNGFFINNKSIWEAYAYENLFVGTHRFNTKKEAEKLIRAYLN